VHDIILTNTKSILIHTKYLLHAKIKKNVTLPIFIEDILI